MGDWTVDVDESANRMYLSLEGFFDESEAEAAADAVIEAAEQLDEGFEEINDMSEFQPSDQAAMEHIERGKRGIVENGVEAVVRVTAESATGQMQFDRAGEGAESYAVAKADTVEQAEQLLDERDL